MITKSKHLEAVIRRHWRELITECALWIDGYNNSVHRRCVTTLKRNTDTSNVYFLNDPRPRPDSHQHPLGKPSGEMPLRDGAPRLAQEHPRPEESPVIPRLGRRSRRMAINLYDGVCGTLHANTGVHCAYNIADCSPRFRTTAFIEMTE